MSSRKRPRARSASWVMTDSFTGVVVTLDYRHEGGLHHVAVRADDGQPLEAVVTDDYDAARRWWAARLSRLAMRGYEVTARKVDRAGTAAPAPEQEAPADVAF